MPKTEDRKKLCKEVIELVFKKSGVDKTTIVDAAMRKFFADNIDLLTPAEKKKYKSVILQLQ